MGKGTKRIVTLKEHPQYKSILRKQKLCLLSLTQAETTITDMLNNPDDIANSATSPDCYCRDPRVERNETQVQKIPRRIA